MGTYTAHLSACNCQNSHFEKYLKKPKVPNSLNSKYILCLKLSQVLEKYMDPRTHEHGPSIFNYLEKYTDLLFI